MRGFEGMPYGALRRYILGTSDAAERRRVEAWAAESAERRAYLAAVGRTWRLAQEASGGHDAATDDAWNALSGKLERPARVLTGPFASKRRWPVVPAAAAAAVLAVFAAGLLLRERAASPVAERPVPTREVATATGQRAEVKLGDGSTVTLGVKSRLRFPTDFGARSRELQLEGEAYFVVVHDSTRPFIVHAAGSKTVDLGTAFALRAYPGDPRVQVVVAEGSVALGADRADAPAPVVLTAGQMGRLAGGTGVATVETVDPAAYTGWVHGRLTFHNTSLAEVAAELGRWYEVDVRLGDPTLARETFSASFTAEPIGEVLRTLTTVLKLRAERSGGTVTLYRANHAGGV